MDRRRFLATAGRDWCASSVAQASRHRSRLRVRLYLAQQPDQHRRHRAPVASRAATICPASGGDVARIVAVITSRSPEGGDAKTLVNEYYAKKTGKPRRVTGYANYHDLLASKDVDAVVISTPDHWHCLIAIDAVEAGKDVYLQKPASLTIAEGRALSNAVQRTGRIFQIGSQQRSTVQFRYAAELVRNGHRRAEGGGVGLPGDPSSDDGRDAVPKALYWDVAGLDASRVLHRARVHPVGRPAGGWLRCEQFSAGMITGWGAHHIDSAHWGMDTSTRGRWDLGARQFPEGAVGRARSLQDRRCTPTA
jgi:predicted dehydrogenase